MSDKLLLRILLALILPALFAMWWLHPEIEHYDGAAKIVFTHEKNNHQDEEEFRKRLEAGIRTQPNHNSFEPDEDYESRY